MNNRFSLFILALFSCVLFSCNGGDSTGTDNGTEKSTAPVSVPTFNAETAYQYIADQVAFGPRTPGSVAQQKCADYMQDKLKPVTDTIYRQEVTVTGGDGKKLKCINLIGSIHPTAPNRVLLLTHWDSRPWADEDIEAKDQPILAADDGGSGVGVLIEIANQLKQHALPPNVGIDILLEDVEDYGRDTWGGNSYCLGTQYWAMHPHVPGYKADFGILLDMVGAKNAVFPMEQVSRDNANDVLQRVYQSAAHAGYSSYFPYGEAQYNITDDHVFVNQILKIPTIDIINLSGGAEHVFPAHWHTHKDNMEVIDKQTLKAVGQTLLQTIYEYASQTK